MKLFKAKGISALVIVFFTMSSFAYEPGWEPPYLRGEPNLPSWERLTSRERQILKLIATGLKTREIAESLCVSTKTVEKHRTNLMRKLNLHSISALTTYAIRNGLLEGI